jgi:hypothetical protein
VKGFRRLRLIAWREYLSYVRTVGFWLSMALMPLGLALGVTLPGLMERAAPQQTVAIIDLTGQGYAPRLVAALREREERDALLALRMAALAAADPMARRPSATPSSGAACLPLAGPSPNARPAPLWRSPRPPCSSRPRRRRPPGPPPRPGSRPRSAPT